jgi:hypothetical protein
MRCLMKRLITFGVAAGLALALLPVTAETQQCGSGYYQPQVARGPVVGRVYRSYSYQPGVMTAPVAPRYGYGYGGYGYGRQSSGMNRGGAWTNATNKALGRY